MVLLAQFPTICIYENIKNCVIRIRCWNLYKRQPPVLICSVCVVSKRFIHWQVDVNADLWRSIYITLRR